MRFKILFLKILLLAISFTSCKTEAKSQKETPATYTISGEIKGLTHDFLFRVPNKPAGYPLKTIKVVDGKFSFTDSISETVLLELRTKDKGLYKKTADGKYFSKSSMGIMVFAYPGADIKITGEVTDFFNAYPSGDKYNNSLAAINKIVSPCINENLKAIVAASYENDTDKKKALLVKADNILSEGQAAQLKHMEESPNSLAVLWYLNDMLVRRRITDDKAIAIFNSMSKDLVNTQLYKELQLRIKGISDTKEGGQVPSIKTLATIDGTGFDINNLKGKYVLIDFWGIWCGPCVAEMPTVKEYQEKYKEKLVVIGVNSGDTKARIQKFVNDRGFTWQHLMSAKGTGADNFVNRFNVKGFPTKFIIDPEGRIVKRYLGSGDEAFALLDKLLK